MVDDAKCIGRKGFFLLIDHGGRTPRGAEDRKAHTDISCDDSTRNLIADGRLIGEALRSYYLSGKCGRQEK